MNKRYIAAMGLSALLAGCDRREKSLNLGEFTAVAVEYSGLVRGSRYLTIRRNNTEPAQYVFAVDEQDDGRFDKIEINAPKSPRDMQVYIIPENGGGVEVDTVDFPKERTLEYFVDLDKLEEVYWKVMHQ